MRPDIDGDEAEEECSSSTTSSIGNDSDASSSLSEADSGENEAQSAYNGPLHMMDSLQQVLPIRKGISKFYNGKSKSFTTLADASNSPSMKEIAKPENAYSRRRRNLMAFNHVWGDKLRNKGGGISKRSILSSSRSSIALAFAINYDSSCSCTSSEDSASTCTNSVSSPSSLPPRHPRSSASSPPWRSFSVADLQHCATVAAATIKIQGSSLGNEVAHPSL